MNIPGHIKEASKVIGYFSYTHAGDVICDDDACVIAGSSEAMKRYLGKMASNSNEKNIIKKTRFGEITEGLRRGGAYAFDEEAYTRFIRHARNNGIGGLPSKKAFSEPTPSEYMSVIHFIRIQMVG